MKEKDLIENYNYTFSKANKIKNKRHVEFYEGGVITLNEDNTITLYDNTKNSDLKEICTFDMSLAPPKRGYISD